MINSSQAVTGVPIAFGDGFRANQFRHTQFAGLMSPFVLVDDYVMAGPTFGPHPHAGISAVTVALEDAVGEVVSDDTLGRRTVVRAGDVHWTLAGSGVVHSQEPETDGVRFHGLQVFVNLPARLKNVSPDSWRLHAADIPVVSKANIRTRVMLGEFDGVSSPARPPQPLLALDSQLDAGGALVVPLAARWNAWVYVLRGNVSLADGSASISEHQARSFSSGDSPQTLQLTASAGAALVVLAGERIDEPLVQQGPFVANTAQEMAQIVERYQRGEFGAIK